MIAATIAVVAVVAIAAVCVIAYVTITETMKRHQAERLQWREERQELMAQMKYLNDRFLAQHGREAAFMDQIQGGVDEVRELRERGEPARLLPEGL